MQHALRPRDLLLVLDNLEHLLDAAPPLAELLATCPRLCILATSRAPLRLRAEQLYPVQPLALPTDGEGATAALQSPAVALFVQRATAVAPEFTLNDENAASCAARRPGQLWPGWRPSAIICAPPSPGATRRTTAGSLACNWPAGAAGGARA